MFEFQDYPTMRKKIGELYGESKFTEAAKILEWGLNEFPDHLFANTYNLSACYTLMQEPQKAADTLLKGLNQGLWYGVWDFEAELWGRLGSKYRQYRRFSHKFPIPLNTIKKLFAFQAIRKFVIALLEKNKLKSPVTVKVLGKWTGKCRGDAWVI